MPKRRTGSFRQRRTEWQWQKAAAATPVTETNTCLIECVCLDLSPTRRSALATSSSGLPRTLGYSLVGAANVVLWHSVAGLSSPVAARDRPQLQDHLA